MCFESTKIGYLTFDDERSAAVGTQSVAIVPRGDDRRVLMFGPPSAGRVTLRPDSEVTDRQGFVLNWNDPPLLLRVEDHGDIVGRSWHAISVVGEGPMTARWHETATATNGIATATHAAVAGQRHRILGFGGSYNTAGLIGRLELHIGGVLSADYHVHEQFNMPLPEGSFESAANEAVLATLAAGGVGEIGTANIHGETFNVGDGGITIPVVSGMFKKDRLDKHFAGL